MCVCVRVCVCVRENAWKCLQPLALSAPIFHGRKKVRQLFKGHPEYPTKLWKNWKLILAYNFQVHRLCSPGVPGLHNRCAIIVRFDWNIHKYLICFSLQKYGRASCVSYILAGCSYSPVRLWVMVSFQQGRPRRRNIFRTYGMCVRMYVCVYVSSYVCMCPWIKCKNIPFLVNKVGWLKKLTIGSNTLSIQSLK